MCVCRQCGGPTNQFKTSGKWAKFCGRKCTTDWTNLEQKRRKLAASSPDKYECQQCKNQFWSSRKKRFCSPECRRVPRRFGKRDCIQCGEEYCPNHAEQECCGFSCAMRLRANREGKVARRRSGTCEGCGKQFERTNITNRDAIKYCSRECAFENAPRFSAGGWKRAVGDGMLAVLQRWHICEVCKGAFYGRSIARVCSSKCNSWKSWFASTPKTKPCKVCGCAVERIEGRNHTAMCNACRRDKRLTMRRANKRKRKKKLRSVRIESFGRREIFTRDNWMCQMCGIKVSDTVDVNDDCRANLDHVRPLSKGGMHSRSNCQCLCRKCNLEKGDKVSHMTQRVAG